MTRPLLIVCLAAASAAAAEPSAADLSGRRTELETRLRGQGFTVVVEPPFVIIGDEAPATVRHHAAGILHWSIQLLEAEYFKERPQKLIEIWLFKNERTYRSGAKKYFGDEPDTPYGYYSSEHEAMVMNIGPGAGTLVHEVVHPYIEANFPSAPAWFNEGLASLYERPTEKKGHIWGLPNWRLPNLKRQIAERTLPDMATLLGTSRDAFYNAEFDAYAYARYLLLYLQEQGKLTEFYRKFVADQNDPTGRAALEEVLGEKLETFEPRWRKWAVALKGDNH
ncbi:MAG: hypothetical protein E6J90_00625 [Deltaproteobacteria bacterium]|nr:MAG: hypothetical protein E6J91_19030 [Deltaproteobacteria bacterium]TMQ28388.1 MAG: hypothetical protein E6J90_00625 [Deltaproteobacteria bacterium]